MDTTLSKEAREALEDYRKVYLELEKADEERRQGIRRGPTLKERTAGQNLRRKFIRLCTEHHTKSAAIDFVQLLGEEGITVSELTIKKDLQAISPIKKNATEELTITKTENGWKSGWIGLPDKTEEEGETPGDRKIFGQALKMARQIETTDRHKAFRLACKMAVALYDHYLEPDED